MPNGISFPVPQSALLSTRVDGHQSMKIFKTGFVVGSDLLLMSEYFCTGSACRTCSCVKLEFALGCANLPFSDGVKHGSYRQEQKWEMQNEEQQ